MTAVDPSLLDLSGRLLLAAGLGALVGVERELVEKPAGIRTHVGVALGSALFGIVSAYGFSEWEQDRAATNAQIDVTRVASNVVTGIGFIGGGAILKLGATVQGLTTAASLWVSAAIGLAVGLGDPAPALVTTLILVVGLVALRRPAAWLTRRFGRLQDRVVVHLSGGDPRAVLTALTALDDISLLSVQVKTSGSSTTIVADVEAAADADVESVVADLAQHAGVISVDVS